MYVPALPSHPPAGSWVLKHPLPSQPASPFLPLFRLSRSAPLQQPPRPGCTAAQAAPGLLAAQVSLESPGPANKEESARLVLGTNIIKRFKIIYFPDYFCLISVWKTQRTIRKPVSGVPLAGKATPLCVLGNSIGWECKQIIFSRQNIPSRSEDWTDFCRRQSQTESQNTQGTPFQKAYKKLNVCIWITSLEWDLLLRVI